MERRYMSVMDRVVLAWLKMKALFATGMASRQPAWGMIEFAIGALVFAVVVSVGLKALGTDLSNLFIEMGKGFQMPAGGIGGSS